MSLRPEAMDLDLSVVGLWVSMSCRLIGSHAESRLSVVYTFTLYSTDCIIQYAVFSTLVSSGFSVRVCACIALQCILQSILYCTPYSTLSPLSGFL
jgi:hypothetical protein